MLINLSDVLSDQHKTLEETVPFTMDTIRLKSGNYPVVSSEPVHCLQPDSFQISAGWYPS